MINSRLQADFNGLFQGQTILCLSHSDDCLDEHGVLIQLNSGMHVTAFEENFENGVRDDIIASGIVEPSPTWLTCNGSRWILRIDENGVRYQSDLTKS